MSIIRAASLTFSVRRQMDRIAKYLARGYEWAERPREQPVEQGE